MKAFGFGFGFGHVSSRPAPGEAGPTNLVENDFSSASAPPTLTTSGGTATLTIVNDRLEFRGGTNGNLLSATWTGVATSGAAYTLSYEASGRALSCNPVFQMGGGSTVTGSGLTGNQTATIVAGGSNSNFVITFSPNATGRNLNIENIVSLYRTLRTLTLSVSSVSENVAIGTVVGAIQDKDPGSIVTLSDDAGGLFEIDGGNIVTAGAIDYETATSHDIEITETLAGASGSPKVTPLTIAVNDEPPLNPATLPGGNTIPSGTLAGGYTVAVGGVTGTGVVTLTDDAGGLFGLTGDPASPTLTNLSDISDPPSTIYSIELTGTEAAYENSPLATPLTITVV